MTPFAPLLTQNLPLYAQAGAVPPSTSPIQVVAPPDQTDTQTRVGPSTSTPVPTPDTSRAFEELGHAQDRQAAARAAQVPLENLTDQYEASVAESEATSAQLAEAQRREVIRQHQQKVAALTAEKEKRRQAEEAAAHPTTYWEDRSAPAKILAGFLMVLGGATSGLARTKNGVIEAYDAAAAEDRQRKLDKYTRSVEFRKLAEKDIEGAKEALSDHLAEITQNEISRSNVLKRQLISFAKRSGLPNAMAKAEEAAAKIDAENAEKMVKLGQHWDKTVQSGHTTQSQTINRSSSKAGAPDLTALDKDGKPYGIWRTPQEAEKGREQQTALTTLRGAVEQLNAHLIQHGKLIDPTSKEYADRQALGDAVSRELQAINNAGVLNPGEYERNQKSISTTLFKGGKEAAAANDLMVSSAGRKYESALRGKAVKTDQPVPISQPQVRAASSQPVTPAAAKPAKSPGQVVEKNGKRYQKGADGRWQELD